MYSEGARVSLVDFWDLRSMFSGRNEALARECWHQLAPQLHLDRSIVDLFMHAIDIALNRNSTDTLFEFWAVLHVQAKAARFRAPR